MGFITYSVFDKGTPVGEGTINFIVGCSKNGCLGEVLINENRFYVTISGHLVNMEKCSVRKDSGLSKIIHGEFSCLENFFGKKK